MQAGSKEAVRISVDYNVEIKQNEAYKQLLGALVMLVEHKPEATRRRV